MNAPSAHAPIDRTARQQWMAVLARAGREELERAWRTIEPVPPHQWLRPPETGLTMVRARTGGTGTQFNLGEASVTRCAVRVCGADGVAFMGVAYVLGRDHRQAELAALFDALLQNPSHAAGLQQTLIRKLAAAQKAHREEAGRKAAATRVEFYTMGRGDDAA